MSAPLDLERLATLGQAAPFLKWAGGKSQLLEAFASLLPKRFATYHEPFVGGGALFFRLARERRLNRAHLADRNPDLVLAYETVRDRVQALIEALGTHSEQHSPAHYTTARDRYNAGAQDPVERTALLVYLNKTCFNGLYRVNSRGKFNVPIGRYAKPAILDPARLRAASAALQGASLRAADFAEALAPVAPGDFVYLDPPYVPLSATAHFTAYAREGFGFPDQARLADEFRRLDRQGAKVMLSNHATDELLALYDGFDRRFLEARRNINSRGERRGEDTREVVIRNYE